ncbi:Uncharacterised protein [Pseudomonas aeruginosa]|nr:Uncharacterised protein [Pseudomonas aeruginosa]
MGRRAQPGIADLDPSTRREPLDALHFAALHFARMETLVGAIPVLDAGRRSSRGTTRTPDSHGRKTGRRGSRSPGGTSAGKNPMVPGRSSPARRWKDRESPKPSAYAASRACPAPSPSRTDRASVSPGIPGPGIATPRPGNWRDSPRRFSAHAATRCIRRRPPRPRPAGRNSRQGCRSSAGSRPGRGPAVRPAAAGAARTAGPASSARYAACAGA